MIWSARCKCRFLGTPLELQNLTLSGWGQNLQSQQTPRVIQKPKMFKILWPWSRPPRSVIGSWWPCVSSGYFLGSICPGDLLTKPVLWPSCYFPLTVNTEEPLMLLCCGLSSAVPCVHHQALLYLPLRIKISTTKWHCPRVLFKKEVNGLFL